MFFSVIYQSKKPEELGEVFLDVNKLSADGTTSLSTTSWSKDGTHYAYGLSEKGSDWVTIKFMKNDRTQLPDVIDGVKHSGISWMPDGSGVFYCKYPEHHGAKEGTSVDKHEFHSLYFHKLGTDQKDDVLVYDYRANPDIMIGTHVTEDGRYLIIDLTRGCDPYNMLYYVDLEKNGPIVGKVNPVPIVDKLESKYHYVHNFGEEFYIHTDKDAPNYRIFKLHLSDVNKHTPFIDEKEHKLSWGSPAAGKLLMLSYLEDCISTLYAHDISTGEKYYQIPLGIGTLMSCFMRWNKDELFFTVDSFLTPTIVYGMNFKDVPANKMPELREIRRVKLNNMDVSEFETRQIKVPSRDGTKVNMFIICRKDIELNGKNPTFLNGYGGFNIPDVPTFSITRLCFLKYFGGVVAVANLRGGGEYGEKWHQGGMRENKQNTFDDFQAAAKALIDAKYTCPEKLAIQGGSNGGLLMGACSQQRPELFGAVINRVGVLDMLRFHKFTIGAAWVPEYGNPDEAKDFEFLSKYSPLHNISFPSNGQWPATLLMTADHDDRVVPAHTLKYVAELYHKAKQQPAQSQPLLARIEVSAGHGAGKPTHKVIAEYVDMYSFLQRVLDLEWRG
ncbi:unnamed protein product, partial [Mesorhabditis spiculigera]